MTRKESCGYSVHFSGIVQVSCSVAQSAVAGSMHVEVMDVEG